MGILDIFFRREPDYPPELFELAERYMPDIRQTLDQPRRLTAAAARKASPRLMKIFQDCQKLVNKTLSPDVFFSRYDLMESVLACMVLFQPYARFSGVNAKRELETALDDRPHATLKFIERSYRAMRNGASELKTEKGKANRIIKYFNEMFQFTDRMCPEAVQLLQEIQEL